MVEQDDSKGKGAAMVPYLDQVFGDDGIFPLAGYAPREGQIALAHAVNLSIREGTPVLAEAGTGVGKSFGYLVPAIWHVTQGAPALLAGRLPVDEDPEDEAEEDDTPRALIVTAGITLQEQLTRKDIPTLQRILPWRFTAALAKGRGNYLCLDRLADARAASLDLSFATTDQEREQWATLDAWASATATGDFSELHQEPLPYHRHLVTISSDDCTGKHCPSFASCHFEKARRNIAKAQVIVANYHLLFAHLNLVAEFGRGDAALRGVGLSSRASTLLFLTRRTPRPRSLASSSASSSRPRRCATSRASSSRQSASRRASAPSPFSTRTCTKRSAMQAGSSSATSMPCAPLPPIVRGSARRAMVLRGNGSTGLSRAPLPPTTMQSTRGALTLRRPQTSDARRGAGS